ncbi:MAG: hypothetical protein QM820_45570 [Minicystis sp.]
MPGGGRSSTCEGSLRDLDRARVLALALLLVTPACSPPDAIYDLGGGDAGSGGASTCGATGFADLADDFDDDMTGPLWSVYADNDAVVAEKNQHLEISVPNGGFGVGAYHSIGGSRSLRGCQLSMEVVKPASMDEGIQTFLILRDTKDPLDTDLDITQSGTRIILRVREKGVDMDPDLIDYDPVQHRFWRIREANGTVSFETAPAGGPWTVRHSAPTPEFVDRLQVNIGIAVHTGTTTGALAILDNVDKGP